MLNIILCCEYGASTSLVAESIQKAAEKRGIEAVVEAHSVNLLDGVIGKADILLMGPQVRFLMRKVKKEYESYNIPIICMDPMMYGRVDGEGILSVALTAIEGNK